jgi:signal transduction histidine kinase
MTTYELTIIILAIESFLYLLICAIILKRGNWQERTSRILLVYAAASCLWALQQMASRLGWLGLLDADPYLMARIPLYGLLALTFLFFYLSRRFLRISGRNWPWAVLVITAIVVLVGLDTKQLLIAEVMWLSNRWGIHQLALTYGIAIVTWGLMMGTILLQTIQAYRQAQLPLHRNRIIYWPLAWGFTLVGDLLFFAAYEALGGDVRLLGTLFAAYAVLTHRLPDVRQTVRRVSSYLIMTLLTIAIYTAGFAAVQYFFQSVPGYNPLLAGAVVALILAVLFDPLLRLVQKFVNRIFTGISYDPSAVLSEYSLRISNIVSLERLATVAVGLINEALEVEHGAMFTVTHVREKKGEGAYRLEVIDRRGDSPPPVGKLADDSPITHQLRELRRPLTQYDVDLLPDFHKIAKTERDWLSGLGMDVYVPIHSQASWIGLLALGSKTSGDRYFDEDLAVFSTLADQTAVAFENARLVDDLIEINHDLEEAYATLAKANQQLQEMDKLKSAFIGVITHELRSPFANIAFSLQLFKRYGVENLTDEQKEQLEQLTSSLQNAKAMVDNLITFATFLSKQGELSLEQFAFDDLIEDTLLPLKSMADTKDLTIHTIVPDKLPPVQGDKDRLADAVHHLVQNAIKFTDSGGEVWIRSEVEDSKLLFEVKDTGVGVPADKLPTLWEGFTQIADPLQRGVEGLGLGLALVKYIINAHGGQVSAESQEGKGSTFGFKIPLAGPGQ